MGARTAAFIFFCVLCIVFDCVQKSGLRLRGTEGSKEAGTYLKHPIMSNTSRIMVVPDTTRFGTKYSHYLLAMSLAFIGIPFFIWGIWISVKNWGVWKLHSSGRRPHYIRTWHGWMEAGKAEDRARRHKRRREAWRLKFIWKTTTTDYSWIFWDPQGVKQQKYYEQREQSILRYLPYWTRSAKHGSLQPDFKLAPVRLEAAEEGKVSLRSFRHSSEIQPLGFSFTKHQSWLRSKHPANAFPAKRSNNAVSSFRQASTLPKAPDIYSLATLRKRKGSKIQRQAWNINSRGANRATYVHFLDPMDTSKILSDLSSLSETTSSSHHLTFPYINPRNKSNRITRRIFTFPQSSRLRNACISRHYISPPFIQHELPSRQRRTPNLYSERQINGTHISRDSEDSLESPAALVRNRAKVEASLLPVARVFGNSVNRQLQVWEEPAIIKPGTSVGNEFSGADGRPGSPTTSWFTKGKEKRTVTLRSGGYKIGKPFSATTPRRLHGRSFIYPPLNHAGQRRNLPGIQESSINEPIDNNSNPIDARNGPLDTRDELADTVVTSRPTERKTPRRRPISVSDGAFRGGYRPMEINLKPSFQRFTTPTSSSDHSSINSRRYERFASERFIREQILSAGNPPIFTSHDRRRLDLVPASPLQRVSPVPIPRIELRIPKSTKHEELSTESFATAVFNTTVIDSQSSLPEPKLSVTPQSIWKHEGYLSLAEKAFLEDIDKRLKRLKYELSPGFRGPRGNEADPKWWFEVVPAAVTVAGRASRTWITNSVPKRPLNVPPSLRRSQTASDMSRYQAVNVANERIPRPDSSHELRLHQNEPEESWIDTAAWIPRRPPMKSRRIDPGEKRLLFTSGRCPAKSLIDWQRCVRHRTVKRSQSSAPVVFNRRARQLRSIGNVKASGDNDDNEKKRPRFFSLDSNRRDKAQRYAYVVLEETS